jgi:RNA polymerase sigma factor (sigma-70 family)
MAAINQAPETRLSLILRLRNADDILAWREFVEIYGPVIRAMARNRGLQVADVDDVTQEVLTRVAKSVERWEPDRDRGSFRGWLAAITRNLVIQSFRSRSRLPATGQDSQIVEWTEDKEFDLESERQLFRWAARKVQQQFEPKTWQAFWLTAVDGRSAESVAQQLGTTKAQIYVSRSRVMGQLKETIQRTQFDSFDAVGG